MAEDWQPVGRNNVEMLLKPKNGPQRLVKPHEAVMYIPAEWVRTLRERWDDEDFRKSATPIPVKFVMGKEEVTITNTESELADLVIQPTKKQKRQPLMIDMYLSWDIHKRPVDSMLRKKTELRLRDLLLEAKRFVLDADACRYVAEVIRDMPEAIARGQDFAIPPFRQMYVELPHYRLFWETVTGRVPEDDSDNAVGYLFDGPAVYTMSNSPNARVLNMETGKKVHTRVENCPMFGPLKYLLNVPMKPEEENYVQSRLNKVQGHLDHFFWGEAVLKLTRDDDVRALRTNHSVHEVIDEGHPEYMLDSMWENLYFGSASDLRNIVALLLIMNRGSEMRYDVAIGPQQSFVRAKPRTLVSHHVLKFKLNPVPGIRKVTLGGASGRYRREHPVKGHFCHNKEARERQCLHDWEETGIHRWRCMNVGCGGKRWWKKDHQRGKKGKGKITTEYEVTE